MDAPAEADNLLLYRRAERIIVAYIIISLFVAMFSIRIAWKIWNNSPEQSLSWIYLLITLLFVGFILFLSAFAYALRHRIKLAGSVALSEVRLVKSFGSVFVARGQRLDLSLIAYQDKLWLYPTSALKSSS